VNFDEERVQLTRVLRGLLRKSLSTAIGDARDFEFAVSGNPNSAAKKVGPCITNSSVSKIFQQTTRFQGAFA